MYLRCAVLLLTTNISSTKLTGASFSESTHFVNLYDQPLEHDYVV